MNRYERNQICTLIDLGASPKEIADLSGCSIGYALAQARRMTAARARRLKRLQRLQRLQRHAAQQR